MYVFREIDIQDGKKGPVNNLGLPKNEKGDIRLG